MGTLGIGSQGYTQVSRTHRWIAAHVGRRSRVWVLGPPPLDMRSTIAKMGAMKPNLRFLGVLGVSATFALIAWTVVFADEPQPPEGPPPCCGNSDACRIPCGQAGAYWYETPAVNKRTYDGTNNCSQQATQILCYRYKYSGPGCTNQAGSPQTMQGNTCGASCCEE
ncbi:MAG: hypothetical protein AMXMBFR81_27130 [Chthonomonas sp.]